MTFEAAAWRPLPLVARAAPGGAVPALLAWAAANGAWFDPIEVVVDGTGNRSVRTRGAVATGELLVAVPRALMITDGDATADGDLAVLGRIGGTLHSKNATLALWLAREQAAEASPWRPYLDALPPAFPWLPWHRPAADLAALTDTFALELIQEMTDGCVDDLELAEAWLGELDVSLADFAWGRAVTASRCFRVDLEHTTRALVPVADFFDHGPADGRWGYAADAGRFEVRAARDLAAGEPVHLRYGAHGNALYVVGHGFAEADNPADEAVVRLATPDGPQGFVVGARLDRQLERAIAAAQTWPGATRADALVAVAAAAAAASSAIAIAPDPPAGDPAWATLCARVRAGERAVLARLVALLDELRAEAAAAP